MLKSRQSTTGLQDGLEIKEDETIKEPSPARATKSRRALGDVSNKNSRNVAVDWGKRTTIGDNEKQSLRRSRRLSTMNCPGDDFDEQETKVSSAQVQLREPFSKTAESEETRNVHHNATATIHSQADKKNDKLPSKIDRKPATNGDKNKARTRKRTKKKGFDIESMLLEPRPKRKRSRPTTKPIKNEEKKDPSIANNESEKRSGEIQDLKLTMERQNTVISLLQNSDILLHSKNRWCPDLLTTCDDDYCLLRKLEGPFDASKFTTGIAVYDKKSEGKVGDVPAYVTDIFQRLFDAEKMTRPSASYMSNQQQEINSTMRAIVVDWLVGVQTKFRLQPETLYLCVNIIDRYLSRTRIRRRRLQLLGISALFVACKYEEIYPIEVKDCVYISDRAVNRQDVLDMEFDIVMVLGFKMTVPTAYPFLQRFLHITNAPKIIRDLASFYTERMLQEYCMLNFRASLVASAAVCLAWTNPTANMNLGDPGNSHQVPRVLDTITNYTGFCESEIRHTVKVICGKMEPRGGGGQQNLPRLNLSQVNVKYHRESYSSVSSYVSPDPSHLNLL